MLVIYKITNKLNNKFYIGLTKRYKIRVGQHAKGDGRGHLAKSIKKNGWDNFSIEIIDTDAVSYKHLQELEIWYIAELKPDYNETKGGEGCVGRKLSEESRNKLSNSLKNSPKTKNKKMHPNTASALANRNKGNQYNKGRKQSQEQRDNTSKFFTNRKQTPEHIEKKRLKIVGRKATEETKKKLSDSHKGQPAWNKGKKMDPEVKERMLASRAEYYRKKREQKQLLLKDV